MNVHAPFTTAHQLYGESLFYLLMDDPQGARVLFDTIWSMYQAIFVRLSAAIGTPPLSKVPELLSPRLATALPRVTGGNGSGVIRLI